MKQLFYFGLLVFFSSSEWHFVDCKPAFTKTPSSNGKVYVEKGTNPFDLSWDFNTDGEIVTWVDLMYKKSGSPDVLIARKIGNRLQVPKTSNYYGRVTAGSGKATFVLWYIAESDERTFECKVYFSSVSNPWIMSAVKLIVVVKPKIILRTTQAVVLTEGNTRTLLCVASGNPKPSYTWYKNNVKVQEDSNNSNYTLTSANRYQTGMYRCEAVVTAPALGPYKADYNVSVTVRYKPQHKVNSLERNETVYLGRDAMFYCRTEAFPIAIQYSWFKDDFQISNSRDYTIDNFGFGESRLTVKQVTKSSVGRYSCYGNNDVGNGKKKSVFLTVHYAPLQITLTPDPAVVRLNQTMILACQADALPLPRYSWMFNGKTLTKAVYNTLELTSAQVNDAGNYTCVAENFYGRKNTTRVVKVEYAPAVQTFTIGTPKNTVIQGTTVEVTCSANGYPAPTFTIKRGNETVNSTGGRFVIRNIQLKEEDAMYTCEPNNTIGTGAKRELKITVQVSPTFSRKFPDSKKNTKEGGRVSYLCVAEGKPAPNITWTFNGKNLTDEPPFVIQTTLLVSSDKLKTTQSSLAIEEVTWREGGTFSCLAFNDAGQKIQSTELEVEYRPVVQSLADHPKNLTVDEGKNATFFCRTKGYPPTISHKWQFNGATISGANCFACPSMTFTKYEVNKTDSGWYSCSGSNNLGEGPYARAYLTVKYRPTIISLREVYTVNETGNVSMLCRADGLPKPTIIWRKKGSGEVLANGEQFHLLNAQSTDDGSYSCTTSNYLGEDTKEVMLNVQTHPKIKISSSADTVIPGNKGDVVTLICTFSGKPLPRPSWRRQLNGTDLGVFNGSYVKNISQKYNSSFLNVIVNNTGEHFYCVVSNLLGSDNLTYTIRRRGVPDPPSDVKLSAFKVADAKTVSVNVSWTPGYSGGYEQKFSIYFRVKGSDSDFVEKYVGHSEDNLYTIQGLNPKTEYEFIVQASNIAGLSQKSTLVNVVTPESSIPANRGKVNATRNPDDASLILVEWTIEDKVVRRLNLEIQEGGDGDWKPVSGASNMSTSIKRFTVGDLRVEEVYRFRVDMRRPREQRPVYVFSDVVPAGQISPIPEKREKKVFLFPTWMISVIAGSSGALLLLVLVLCLCRCRRRRKTVDEVGKGKKNPTSSYVVGGPDVVSTKEGRGSCGAQESIEDDPFVVAASMQALDSTNGRKKKLDATINYGYEPEEILLKPGSRQEKNGHVVQSKEEPESNSAYPAKGPQRDFNTFATSVELVRTPSRNTTAVENPVYVAVDEKESSSQPKASTLPLPSKNQNGSIKGPLDPTVHYATSQKKKTTKQPSQGPLESANAESPLHNTSEDKPQQEPSLGDLDLDDPSSLPASERPPEKPTPIAMLPSRNTANTFPRNLNKGSPGPPGFFYIPVNRKARAQTYGADMPHQPPPPGLPRKRYATVDGQLKRLNSEGSEDSRSSESTQKTHASKPEEPTDCECDISGVSNMSYVSYLV